MPVQSAAAMQDAGVDTIGGYRLVRLLGFGPRAEVYLGHAGTAASGTPRVAAIKLYRPGVGRLSVDTELEALDRAEFPHLLQLRDVATDRSGMPSAILQRLGADNLAQILIGRDELAAGEAVTILAPLVQAVAELHRVGVAHQAVRLSNVLFDETGGPVLAGFGASALIGTYPAGEEHSLTAAQLSGDSAARADLRDMALLCRRVLDRTRHGGGRNDELSELLDAATSDGDLDARSFPDVLADRLFDLADPLPVTLTPPPRSPLRQSPAAQSPLAQSPPAQIAGAHPVPGRYTGEPGGAAAARAVGRHHALHRRCPGAVGLSWAARLPAWVGRIRIRRVPFRTPFWVAGGAGVAVLVAALAIIPPEAPAGHHPAISASASPAPSATPSPLAGAVAGDDPVEATKQLLQARAGCLHDGLVQCLSSVDQEDSAAMDSDKRTVAAPAGRTESGEGLLFPIAGATLVERLGDGALVSITLPGSGAAPVSVLVVRTGGGWRIRDVLIG